MSHPCIKLPAADGELARLVERMCDSVITPAERDRLEYLLAQNNEAKLYYIAYLDLHAQMQWLMRDVVGEEVHQVDLSAPDKQDIADLERTQRLWPEHADINEVPHPSIPPIIIDPPSSFRSPLFTLQSPVGSFVFSHVAAAVILGIGLLLGLAWRISLPVGGDSGPRSPDIAQTIGRITALADCKWTKQGAEVRGPGSGISEIHIPTSPNPQIPVFLGDRFLVSSGLMQITYNSGAKVILEGPCTYEIDAARGGYLAVGKLTALVEKGSGVRGPGSGVRGQGFGNANHAPLFAVRTPTAVVTDLGTEFGVEVEESGATYSHVYQGKVELRENSRISTSPKSPVEILHTGESARVERGRNRDVVITRKPGQPSGFVRQIPSSLSQSSRTPDPGSQPPLYRLTDLGTLGGAMSQAYGINALGVVVGESQTGHGTSHAFLYENGKLQDLGTLHDGNSTANDINTAGHVVGTSTDKEGRPYAFCFAKGLMKNLGTLGGNRSHATAINDAGAIAGMSMNEHGVMHACLYTDKGMTDLGALGGPRANSWADGINAAGLVVGASEVKGELHAFLYSPTAGMTDLGTLGGTRSQAFRINDKRIVLGASATRDGAEHVFVYTEETGMRELNIMGELNVSAFDINNAGQIVGSFRTSADIPHAFLYRDGKVIDLNATIDPALGWNIIVASAINDHGYIAGFGMAPDGSTRAFLLTPRKESHAGD